MKFITLTMIVRENVTRGGQSVDPDLLGEDDNLVDIGEAASDNVVSIAPQYEIVESKPVTIGLDSIRNFYPRKNNAPGTRVILKSGVAYVVTETHDQILAGVNV